MKKRYYFIIILVILIPILIVTSLIKDSNQKPAIKIKDNEIITSVPNCSEPTIKIDKIRNIKLLDNVEIGNKQIGCLLYTSRRKPKYDFKSRRHL